ncbi:hypothetical protein ACFX2I_018470 [Malus domestica]
MANNRKVKLHFPLYADVPKKRSSRKGSRGSRNIIELCSNSSSRSPGRASYSSEVPNTFRESSYRSQTRSGGKQALDSIVDEMISPGLNHTTWALNPITDRMVSPGRSYATRAPDSIARSPDPYAGDEAGSSRAPSRHHPRCPQCFDYSLLLSERETVKGHLQHAEHQVDHLRGELMATDRAMSVAHSDGIYDGFKQSVQYFRSKAKTAFPSVNWDSLSTPLD